MDNARNRSTDELLSGDKYGDNNYQRPPQFDDNRSPALESNHYGGQFDGRQNKQNAPIQGKREVAFITPSLEDRMMMKTLNRESFFYRCIPFAVISSACYYYYNEQRKRPHSFFKYGGIIFAAYIAGKFSYLKECQRRLMESPSNSAFVNKLRNAERLGYTTSYTSYTSPDVNDDLNKSGETTLSNWADPVASEFAPDDAMLDPNRPSPIHQQPQPTTLTYDELRARNRDIYERTSRRN